jgi:hypothetical protein
MASKSGKSSEAKKLSVQVVRAEKRVEAEKKVIILAQEGIQASEVYNVVLFYCFFPLCIFLATMSKRNRGAFQFMIGLAERGVYVLDSHGAVETPFCPIKSAFRSPFAALSNSLLRVTAP